MRRSARWERWRRSMLPACSDSRLFAPSHSGRAGYEEYAHDANIIRTLAGTALLAVYGGPGHLVPGGADHQELFASGGTVLCAGGRMSIGYALPVYPVFSLGSRLAHHFPGGRGSAGRAA